MNTHLTAETHVSEHDLSLTPILSARDVAHLVGSTPVSRYATWDDHRRDISRMVRRVR